MLFVDYHPMTQYNVYVIFKVINILNVPMREWKELKKELLQNPEVRKEYERLGPRFEIISQVMAARIKKGITQKQLAQKIGTKQSAIARLESGNTNPSLGFLKKIADVMGYKLTVHLTR